MKIEKGIRREIKVIFCEVTKTALNIIADIRVCIT
jgi:hypothetical protein